MIEDKDTNIVYLSKWLKDEHEDFYKSLTSLFDSLEIKYDILKYTYDYWCRDYMPIQLNEKNFIKYRYYPDYLLGSQDDKDTITNSSRACKCLGIEYRETDFILDGGNITPCGDRIVMTDKVFSENYKSKGDKEFLDQLETILEHKIIIIPWTRDNSGKKNADVYGHSDGFIHWCGGNNVLMSNHRENKPKEAEEIRQILEKENFNVTEMLFNVKNPNPDYNWAYINYLQVGNKIIVPTFGIEEDEQALKYISEANLHCDIRQIRMRDIANGGGALHCITWNIKQ